MAQQQLFGLFSDAGAATEAMEGFRSLGVPENRVTLITSVPYRPHTMGRRHVRHGLGRFTAIGAVVGAILAIALTVGTPLLYPLLQGNQPIIPIPPSLILLFELTMLGIMWVTFGGFFVLNRFPTFGQPANDRRITDGDIGVLVETDSSRLARAEEIFQEAGATHVERLQEHQREDVGQWRLWGFTVLLIVGVVGLLGGLLSYDIIRIPYPSQMIWQDSIDYQEGPRLAAPAEAVPVTGAVLIAGQPGSAPPPADANSLQRGAVLYNMHCLLCHGERGAGDGPISGFWAPTVPRNLLAADMKAQSNEHYFTVITNGFGVMPPLRENLSVRERWDVVNHVRELQK